MATRNDITLTRGKIKRATKELIDMIEFSTSNIEVEYDNDTMLYADIEVFDYDDYEELELTNLLLVRDSSKGYITYNNIAEMILQEVDQAIRDINQSKKEWDLQSKYETAGNYAYL